MKKKYILVLIVVAFLGYGIWSSGLYMFLRGYLHNSEPTVSEVFPPTEYYPSLHSNVKAVVLIVHGLNLKPSKMSDLGTFLQESDFEVYTANLTGHRGSFEELKKVTRAIWLEDFYGAYQIASARARELKVPIYFLGFSHGAVLGLDALLSKEDIQFEKMILFAPAVATHLPSWIVYFVYKIVPSLVFPSGAPRDYRANDYGSLQANVALFESVDLVAGSEAQKANVLTTVIVDPQDELVSYSGIKDFISTKKMDKWTVEVVSVSDSELSRPIHHLIIDKISLGKKEWSRVTQKILESFN